MERSTLVNPWRVLLGLLPLCYAGPLLIEIGNTFFWLGVIVLGLLVLLVLVGCLGAPLIACWPVFTGLVLVLTCSIMLYQGAPIWSALPLTHSNLELWVMGLVGGLVMLWAGITTRQVTAAI